jgi:hypothetical protein
MNDTCEKHCEATAFKIVIRGLEGEVARLKEALATWVGLTDEEMMEAIHMDDSPMEMGRKIEAKLKEKNT